MTFLQGGIQLLGCLPWATLILLFVVPASNGLSDTSSLSLLGPTLDYSYEPYSNWAGTVSINSSFLVIYPRGPKQVAEIANWAHTHKRHLRVQGFRHTFSTLLLGPGDSASDTVILDMRRHMKSLKMGSVKWTRGTGSTQEQQETLKTVICQAGVSMDSFFNFTESNGVSVSNAPVLGDATIGGVLAIGGHGQAVRTRNGGLKPGFTFGSMSNAILGLKAVVWEEKMGGMGMGKYRLKSFSRTDPDSGPFLMHIGRALITEFTLMVGEDYNMRMVSYTDIPRTELFSTDNSSSSSSLRTFTSFMDRQGGVDALLYTFVDTPWLRIFSTEESESQPAGARVVTEPYPFSSFYGRPLTSPPTLGPQVYQGTVNGLRETQSGDVWGRSKNLLLNMNMPPTPGAFNGFVVITSRANVQRVGKELTEKFVELTEEYKAKGKVPIEQLIELRTNGLDDPRDVPLGGGGAATTARAPTISPLRPVKGRPEWDVGVWMNTFTTSGAEGSFEFMRRFEEWAYARFNGTDGLVRPEWAKLWGYSDGEGPQGNGKFLTETIPRVFGVAEWNKAIGIFDKYDPHKTFTNKFLRELLVPYKGPGTRQKPARQEGSSSSGN